MTKELTAKITTEETAQISDFDSRRCSQRCTHCWKEDGIYHCFLTGHREKIEGFEGFEDVDTKEYDNADTYGFKRTERCIAMFGGIEEEQGNK